MAEGITARAWARGGSIFAATVMVIIGIYQIFVGIAAIAQDDFFIITANYAYEIDTTAWGWVHLGVGILAFLAGLYIYTGHLWARIIGIALATLSAVANFLFLPYYPLWSLLIIALDIFVIWALASAGRRSPVAMDEDMTAGAAMGQAGYAGYAGAMPSEAYGTATQSQAQRWRSTNPATAGAAGRHWADEKTRQTSGEAEPGMPSDAPTGTTPADAPMRRP